MGQDDIWQVGAYELSTKALLAPMAGITDRAFRQVAADFGAQWTVSEMVASNALATGHGEMIRKLAPIKGRLHIVQLAGNEAQWMRRGAEIAADAGADVIDINFGCPSKRVTNGYAGSALMRVPDQALQLIEAVAEAGKRPITVKMRLGWDDDNLNAPTLAKLAESAGAQMIVVHGRTRQQFYKGSARWALVKPVVDAVKVPVVVNGDIVDAATAEIALRQSGARAVMLGRGAQGQPWKVAQIAAHLAGQKGPQTPTGAALADLICAHHEAMLENYGTELGVRVARKHLGWYLDANAPHVTAKDRKVLLTESDPVRARQAIRHLFEAGLERAA